ncbi:hypothetical protein [Candidatus Tisiphia endosymbiont of Nemotelus uliginosus]|uniref:hypothetical protein n=1 Tax=Candidatus Tisiphia endosymbiont of Nemotelus uliginosus TaxID=3077926 RepID=UPI0035C8DE5A
MINTFVSWGTKLMQWLTAKNLMDAIGYAITQIMLPIEKVGNIYKYNFDTHLESATDYQGDDKLETQVTTPIPQQVCKVVCEITCQGGNQLLDYIHSESAHIFRTPQQYAMPSMPYANFDDLSADNSIGNYLEWLHNASVVVVMVQGVFYVSNYLCQTYNSRGAENNNNAVALPTPDVGHERAAQSGHMIQYQDEGIANTSPPVWLLHESTNLYLVQIPLTISISEEDRTKLFVSNSVSSHSVSQSLLAITERGEEITESLSTNTVTNSVSSKPPMLAIKAREANVSDEKVLEGFWELPPEQCQSIHSEQSLANALDDYIVVSCSSDLSEATTTCFYEIVSSEMGGGQSSGAPEGWDIID